MGTELNSKEEGIKLKSLQELVEVKRPEVFIIPDYQRGYRWEKAQVEALLDDLLEFYVNVKKNEEKGSEEIYCVQPLVVKKMPDNSYHVIDGQQRLTTLHILLSCLGVEDLYSIKYQTREDSKDFLDNIVNKQIDEASKKSDYYYMYHAKETMLSWIKKHTEDRSNKGDESFDKSDFLEVIKNRVTFIWYPTDQDEIKVFKDLNIGKISLTESELIKALFLNSNNFQSDSTSERERMLSMVEMAEEWDRIEYHLHDERFWLFFHDTEYSKPTRIDYILELCMEMECGEDKIGEKDAYPVFSYYYKKFKEAPERYKYVFKTWNTIMKYYNIINEWFNNDEYYHYIGFLSAIKNKNAEDVIIELIKDYKALSDKEKFKKKLVKKVKDRLPKECKDLDYVYEEEKGKKKKPKTTARPLLLLHNIETILDQNKKNEKKYDLADFVRFPFHLYKKENWDIEHIRPNNKQIFNKEREKNERAKYVCVQEKYWNKKDLEEPIEKYRNAFKGNDKEAELNAFYSLLDKINQLDVDSSDSELGDDEKNQIWNYVLLDASTNREYGNSCYAIKRDYILKKKSGKKPVVELDEKEGKIKNDEIRYDYETSFVPVCTEMVFSKAYSQYPNNLKSWDRNDAEAYKKDIKEKLARFIS